MCLLSMPGRPRLDMLTQVAIPMVAFQSLSKPSISSENPVKAAQVSNSFIPIVHQHAPCLPISGTHWFSYLLASITLSGLAGPTVADHEAFWAEWALRIQTLELGIEQARQQGISLSRAKRVLKELQAQANAAEAASKLETLLQRRPCKASVLKVSSCAPCAMMHSLMVSCSPL